MLTLQPILNFLESSTGKIYIAFSGGMDSTVLLDLLTKQASTELIKKVHAVHIHHGLSCNADQWSSHCVKQAVLRCIPIQIIKVNAKKTKGESPEAAARRARYQAFAEFMHPNDYLLIAHHQDDQVETFFLQLFRGSGIKGLSGISAKRQLNEIQLIRPLLDFSRNQLQEYAIKNNLQWIDDESNFDTQYQRNFLRHALLPEIKKKWPGLDKTILRSQMLLQEANQLLRQIAEMDFRECASEKLNIINTTYLLTLTVERRANILRYWIGINNIQLPSKKKLQQIEDCVLLARPDANPIVCWEDIEIRRYQDNLYLLNCLDTTPYKVLLNWDIKTTLTLPGNLGKIDASIYQHYGIPLPQVGTKVSIRFRQGGERLQLPHRAGHHELKKLFQELSIPPWQRNRIPLLYHDEELISLLT